MKKLRRRFILYNIAIIGAVAVIIAMLVYFGAPAPMPAGRILATVFVMFGLICIGSALSSKIAMKPVQSSWQRQLDFTADASHELRTPLAVIQTNLELVMDNADETVGSQRKWLENIHMEAIRMTSLIDDLLTLSRGDAGEKTLDYSVFSLPSIAEETAALFAAAADRKGISIQIITDGDVQLYADLSRIKQLCHILVENAVKYMDMPGQIQMAISQKENIVQLVVSDTGKGIAPEHLTNVFNRFYRADKQAADGFGLGLSIAEWIVHEHGGSIRADSVPGKGARFTVRIPAGNASPSRK